MLNITELEIVKSWGKCDFDNPKVTICCTAYNQEKYIAQCLDGFIIQKTNFPFEIIVHDDASNDRTADIIREYEEKYPNIIKPIYQIENQYSKKDGSLNKAIDSKIKGKYVALCEGDDYWCDRNKLQKQFELMENNPNCSMCLHNTWRHDLSLKNKDTKFAQWNKIYRLTEKDIFFGWKVHTSSYFMRRCMYVLPNLKKRYWFGDYVRLTWAFYCGDVFFLPETMSVYNMGNLQGVTKMNHTLSIKKRLQKIQDRIDYLNEFNELTDNKYLRITNERINEINFQITLEKMKEILCNSNNRYEIIDAVKMVNSHSYYHLYLKDMKFIQRCKNKFKFEGYSIYPIWKFIWDRYLLRR